jgi:hypothetical protein
VIIILFHPHHHAVTDKGPHAAGVRVVREHPRKRRIVAILVMIDPLPGPVRIVPNGFPTSITGCNAVNASTWSATATAATVPAVTFKTASVIKTWGPPSQFAMLPMNPTHQRTFLVVGPVELSSVHACTFQNGFWVFYSARAQLKAVPY